MYDVEVEVASVQLFSSPVRAVPRDAVLWDIGNGPVTMKYLYVLTVTLCVVALGVSLVSYAVALEPALTVMSSLNT